jgi:hypothetical protein
MKITEKASYIQGLMEGMDLDKNDKQVKILYAMTELLEEMARTIESLSDDSDEINDRLDDVESGLDYMLEDMVGDEDSDNGRCSCCDEDEDDCFEIKCPNCGNSIEVNDDMVTEGSVTCPNCNEEISMDDIFPDEDYSDEDNQ